MNSSTIDANEILPEFDLLYTPLKGHILIEASAGTGKTYTISRLFLRLLLEDEYLLSSILVVTFTEAATQELKERIYLLIKEAHKAFSNGSSDDPFLSNLISRIDSGKACSILESAAHNFDTVSIHTIHGFCQKVLYENSFESGTSFESTIITDQSLLVQEITHDFWRLNFYSESPVFLAYAIQSGLSPQRFMELLRVAGRSNQNLKIIPEVNSYGNLNEEEAFTESFQRLKESWSQCRFEVIQALEKGNLKANKYSSRIIQELIISMDTMLGSEIADPILFEKFENFTPSVLNNYVKKDCTPPEHPFFSLCEKHQECNYKLNKCYNSRIIYLKTSFLHYLNQELTSRKKSRGQLYFDDLLNNVHSALLDKDQSGELIAKLRKSFKVALIDEFQDTDPVQYEIFSTIFDTLPLFFIGDPKQSIYGFRGADIFTYLHASELATARYTLTKNYRSDASFLSALNTLFSGTSRQFVYEEINYINAVPGIAESSQKLVISDVNQPSLNFIFIDEETLSNKRNDKMAAICTAVTAEISRLISLSIQNEAFIGSNKLKPSDLAILVRTNREAEMMQQYLSVNNIPSIIDSGISVFETEEAVDLLRFLSALLDPTRAELIRAVLVSSFFQLNANTIEKISADLGSWEKYATKFLHYHDLWHENGFMYMFRYFLNEEHIRLKFLSLQKGERKLTNILHLSELIHLQEQKQNSGMTSVHSWLLQKITDTSTQISDEEMLRLESDKDAVTIITVHKSKGLEYPVVFCPFWHSSELRDKNVPYVFHDHENNNRLILALDPDEVVKNQSYIEKESLAENMRLLYVAVTRAKSCCYMVWGKLRGTETSALAYLLHKNDSDSITVSELSEKVRSISSEQIWQILVELNKLNPSISVFKAKTEFHDITFTPTDTHQFSCLELNSSIPEPWKISSFSSLTKKNHSAESPDYDFISDPYSPINENEIQQEHNIFDFPKGSTAGTFMHSVLEKIDFTEAESANSQLVIDELLKFYGFDLLWNPVIYKLVINVVKTQLIGFKNIRLCDIHKNSCIKEMEFSFPLKRISPADLQQIFTNQVQMNLFSNGYQAEKLYFSPTKGYMKGFIDLIFECDGRFFLLDWKSNHLGNRPEDYEESRLKEVMKTEHYILQYYIYLTALDKYLEYRYKGYSYQNNFGGVYYVFLRGIDEKTGSGIFFDRPDEKLIKKMREVLIG